MKEFLVTFIYNNSPKKEYISKIIKAEVLSDALMKALHLNNEKDILFCLNDLHRVVSDEKLFLHSARIFLNNIEVIIRNEEEEVVWNSSEKIKT